MSPPQHQLEGLPPIPQQPLQQQAELVTAVFQPRLGLQSDATFANALPSQDLGEVLQWQQLQLHESLLHSGSDFEDLHSGQQGAGQQGAGERPGSQPTEDAAGAAFRGVRFDVAGRPSEDMVGRAAAPPQQAERESPACSMSEGGSCFTSEDELEDEEEELMQQQVQQLSWCWHEVVAKRCVDPVSGE